VFFTDRADAGVKLALELFAYRGRKDVFVVGLARGGVAVAHAVARALGLPLDVCVVRKIGAPGNEELAIGAVTEMGGLFYNESIIASLGISPKYIKEETARQKETASKRAALYRSGKKAPSYKGKTVILVDDGIATGATMHAALKAAKAHGAKETVLAVPVAPPGSMEEFAGAADRIVCLYTPKTFFAVGQFYREFDQVDDSEVVAMLNPTD